MTIDEAIAVNILARYASEQTHGRVTGTITAQPAAQASGEDNDPIPDVTAHAALRVLLRKAHKVLKAGLSDVDADLLIPWGRQ